MRIVAETIAVAFGMFSRVPMPQPEWNGRNMRFALCAFPLVGVVVGAAACGWCAACAAVSAPELLRGGGLALIPVLVTGGIHLDGYADTCDALASMASPARRREILEDPHCGAFAIVRLCTYFIAYVALACSLAPDVRALLALALGYLLERALSGYAVAAFPLAKDTGLAHAFASAADKKPVARFLVGASSVLACAMAAVAGVPGVLMALASLLVLLDYRHRASRLFGGITGDLAGWFLQRAELGMLGVLVACQLVSGVIA